MIDRQHTYATHICDCHYSLQGFDPARGYLCGIMTASDVPLSSEPIVTFWEGGACAWIDTCVCVCV